MSYTFEQLQIDSSSIGIKFAHELLLNMNKSLVMTQYEKHMEMIPACHFNEMQMIFTTYIWLIQADKSTSGHAPLDLFNMTFTLSLQLAIAIRCVTPKVVLLESRI